MLHLVLHTWEIENGCYQWPSDEKFKFPSSLQNAVGSQESALQQPTSLQLYTGSILSAHLSVDGSAVSGAITVESLPPTPTIGPMERAHEISPGIQ